MGRARRPSRHSSWSSCETMGSIPESPSKIRARNRDTGFPEPFCGSRNTTLPHPDADLSPDACISSDNMVAQRMMSRHRRSFLVKHKHTTNHGKITPEMERQYSDLRLLEEEEGELISTPASPRSRRSMRSSGGSISITSNEPFTRRDSAISQLDTTDSSIKSRRSIFRRLIRHY